MLGLTFQGSSMVSGRTRRPAHNGYTDSVRARASSKRAMSRSPGMTCAVLTWMQCRGEAMNVQSMGMYAARGSAHVGRDEKVVVGEFKIVTTCEDRWLARKDVVCGGHWGIDRAVGRGQACFCVVYKD